MKAVIICSVHALCSISQLEREAYNRACEIHNLPATLTAQDHARLLSKTTMLGFLNHFPGPKQQRERLITSYLDILNDELWATALPPNKTVTSAILGQKNFSRPKGFVSDYPLLTSNMLRSAALLTNASRLGHLTAVSDPVNIDTTAAGLVACAASMGIAHHDTEVLVAHRRDFIAAQSIGMLPRFIEGLRPTANTEEDWVEPRTSISTQAIANYLPIPPTVAASA